MREFKLEPYYVPEARQAYDGLDAIHQADIARRVEFLCEYPDPDDERTFAWPEDGWNVYIFYDDAWLLVDALVDDASVLEIRLFTPVGRL